MAIAAAAGLSRATAETTTTTTTWKCARKRNQYTTDGRTDGRMDAGAEAGSDRLSCDLRRHCQRRLIHVSIYIPERRVDNAVTGTLAAGHQHAPQKSNNANICSPARVTVKYEEPSGVLRGGDEILWHANFFSVLKKI